MRTNTVLGLLFALAISQPAGGAIFPVTNKLDVGYYGTLREAIDLANATPGRDTILFTVPPIGLPLTIQPTNALPVITDPVDMDGWSQLGVPGCGAGVEIDGSLQAAGDGLWLATTNCVLRGLCINRMPRNGILIWAGGGHAVYGCFIGTDIAGTTDWGNTADGILIVSSVNNAIGQVPTYSCTNRNIISGNGAHGVELRDSAGTACSGNLLQNNHIGVDFNGSAAIPNDGDGVCLDGSLVTGNDIGSMAAPKPVNVISGNGTNGVYIYQGSGNRVLGSHVGVDRRGDAPVGNLVNGVLVSNAPSCVVGDSSGETRNIIAGNGDDGVEISAASSIGNYVQGNYIGVGTNGLGAIPNGGDGVKLSGDCTQNLVGDNTTLGRNLISGNNLSGVRIEAFAFGNFVYGNYIGTSADGILAVSNREHGVALVTGANGNSIGSTAPGAGNLISGNGVGAANHGVFGDSVLNNTIEMNVIGLNVLDLALPNFGDGVHLQNSISNHVGTATFGLGNVISGNGNDGVQIGTNSAGDWINSNIIGLDTLGVAPRPNGGEGVSIFRSRRISVGAAGARNVISGNQGSGIRIGDNALATGNRVFVNFIGTDTGGVNRVGNSDVGVWIANAPSNQVGDMVNRNVISGNDSHGIEIEGAGAVENAVRNNFIGVNAAGTGPCTNGGSGIYLLGCRNNTIGGLPFDGEGNVIAGNGADGIQVRSSYKNSIAGNLIGMDAATNPLPNMGNGITIWFNGSSNNSIGSANTIAFNAKAGIRITSGSGLNVGNSLWQNVVYSNDELGIDLDAAGVSVNDDGDVDIGANRLQNYPVIYSATTGSLTFAGRLDTDQALQTFTVYLYLNDEADPSGYGEGQYYLGSTNVVTDINGDAQFLNCVFTNEVRLGQYVTAAAYSWQTMDSSEFSPAARIVANEEYDADADGMPWYWETGHGLDPNDATGTNGAAGDPDGDLSGNYDEYAADTDPQDPGSVFEILWILEAGRGWFTYTCTNSRYYIADYSATADDAAVWKAIHSVPLAGAAGGTITTNMPAATNRFHRVRVQMSP